MQKIDFIKLPDVLVKNQVYGGILIPQERISDLLPHAAIFGGNVEDPMFEELYFGDRAREVLQEAENRDTRLTESYRRGVER